MHFFTPYSTNLMDVTHRTWPHSLTFPAKFVLLSTMVISYLSTRCIASSIPIGPAPIMSRVGFMCVLCVCCRDVAEGRMKEVGVD